RGLDVLPSTISRFRNGGDEPTAALLENVVYPEEITHCAAGIKWFTYLCRRRMARHQSPNKSSVFLSPENGAAEELTEQQKAENQSDIFVGDIEQSVVIDAFHDTVRRYFRGPLKPPFNVEARRAAGFGPDWYEPLAFRAD
ncbi:uncharacterized protein LOC110034894, partial [Phalaenopsis equestris]|uniref:uncharacterized protein LOC110034894 n=1 Tax=Phalaenopsis equestris TaxID=78828 RepID=UPI0009E20211